MKPIILGRLNTKNHLAANGKRSRNWQNYTINLDGSELPRLTEFDSQGAEFTRPQWPPKGYKILCVQTKDGYVKIFVIELE